MQELKELQTGIVLNDSNIPGAKIENTRTVRVNMGEIDSQELFQSERELRIRHGSEIYRLRRTGLNKLILTK